MTGTSTAVLDAPATTPPGVGWASGPLGEVQAADREIARQTARRYRAIAAFAATRPASADRAQGERGAMAAERWAARPEVLRPVSEWAAQELSIALNVSAQRAQDELERSLTLTRRLPLVLDALETGVIHPGHLWCLLEHVAPIADDAVRTRVQRELLDWLAVRHRVTTPAQLGDRVRRVVVRHDARDAARDLASAIRRRGVTARPDRCDGTSVVSALLTTPEAAALVAALGAYADALSHDPADGRTRGQKMADCLLDLVLRPGETDLPPVQVVLSVVAPIGALLGGDQPCEIDGQIVPAELVRVLLAALTGHGLVTPITDSPTTDTDTDTGATDSVVTRDGDGDGHRGLTVDESPRSDQVLLGVTAAEAVRYEAEAGELAAWWAEVERRVLAGEFDAEPPPHFVDEDGPPDLAPSTDSAPQTGSDVADGWWARADRAVCAAGTALLTAQQALGRACRLVTTAERADTADETAWRGSDAGRVTAAPDALAALAAATDQARESLADLLGRTAGGGLADRPWIVLTDAVTGALLALTDPPRLRRAARHGTGLGAPGPTDGYRPGATLDRHVRARDRRCRFPGCRRRVPRGGELDHAVPWPAGPTAAADLTGYCASHHRGKHHAPGWLHRLTLDGTLTVTTPSGMTAVTEPPPY
ncbi:DUF222 domain-containing protein [Geodermatophilus amargosae]|uniref:DUF222 domain-containing protein n=1 Tax=Geodermatophilus amargosae TaxID=1296565 RepID=UPI001C313134|nr:DUF222 domain-containing protein [Geodermatophilus amargosae]